MALTNDDGTSYTAVAGASRWRRVRHPAATIVSPTFDARRGCRVTLVRAAFVEAPWTVRTIAHAPADCGE